MKTPFFSPLKSPRLVALPLLIASTLAFGQGIILKQRCSVDSLDPAAAKVRNRFVAACFPAVIMDYASNVRPGVPFASNKEAWEFARLNMETLLEGKYDNPRPSYFTPVNLLDPKSPAPVLWTAPAVSPDEVQMFDASYLASFCSQPGFVPPPDVGFLRDFRCYSSCFAPEVRIFFPDSYVSIESAFTQKLTQVVTLDESSTLDKLTFKNSKITSWVESIMPEKQTVLKFTMSDGGVLRVTKNHPMLSAAGQILEAKDLTLDSELLTAAGQLVYVRSIEVESYMGKVYNLEVSNASPKGHIIIAEGYLTGSNFLQNEGAVFLNERIFRGTLPDEVTQ